jgi:hypothetical protein
MPKHVPRQEGRAITAKADAGTEFDRDDVRGVAVDIERAERAGMLGSNRRIRRPTRGPVGVGGRRMDRTSGPDSRQDKAEPTRLVLSDRRRTGLGTVRLGPSPPTLSIPSWVSCFPLGAPALDY